MTLEVTVYVVGTIGPVMAVHAYRCIKRTAPSVLTSALDRGEW